MNDLEREVIRVAEEIANTWKGWEQGVEPITIVPSMEDLWIAVDQMQSDRGTPKPSNIDATPKIGDHVRLTGVVTRLEHIDGAPWIKLNTGFGTLPEVLCYPEHLEIIRQPFKRGEVVWNRDESQPEPFVVVNDEEDGVVDVTNCRTGIFGADNPEAFERRP